MDHIINLDTAPTTGRSVGSENQGAYGGEGSTQRANWVPLLPLGSSVRKGRKNADLGEGLPGHFGAAATTN